MKVLVGKKYKNKNAEFTTVVDKIDKDGTVWFKVGSIYTPLDYKEFTKNYELID